MISDEPLEFAVIGRGRLRARRRRPDDERERSRGGTKFPHAPGAYRPPSWRPQGKAAGRVSLPGWTARLLIFVKLTANVGEPVLVLRGLPKGI